MPPDSGVPRGVPSSRETVAPVAARPAPPAEPLGGDATEGLRTGTIMDRRRFLRLAGVLGIGVVAEACATALVPISSGPRISSPMTDPPTRAAALPIVSEPGIRPGPRRPPVRWTAGTVARENRRAGSRAWDDARRSAGVEAYLGAASVGPGDQVSLRATGGGVVDVEWYRLGWYGGRGGRLVGTDRGVRLARRDTPVTDPQTGMVEARWPSVLDVPVPDDTPSGMLVAVLRAADGSAVANAPVILRPDTGSGQRAPVLFVSAAATWQAYNIWGGLSLYADVGAVPVPVTHGRRSAAISFDRPYDLDGGAGYLRRWELQFIRWMEREGREVEYIADIDLELNPALASGRRMIVMAGHPEYWSRPMRTTIEGMVAAGTNVAFLTGNEVYWSVRLGAGPTGVPRIVCYKSAADDPMTAIDPSLATCKWRDSPLAAPEATLVGQMYGHTVRRPADWIVEQPAHWLYEGTGLAAGDRLRNLVGQEFDTFFPDLAPAGTTLLARGPVEANVGSVPGRGPVPGVGIHTATCYTAASGATVVAAGTFQWSWAIDRYGSRSYHGVATPFDPRVGRMTRNVFDRLGDGLLAP